MWTKKEKPSKLLLILGEYIGFSILCGFVNILFFRWAADVIIANYEIYSREVVTGDTQYVITLAIMVASILIAMFVLILLLQRKFSYMLEISYAVEEMEAGNLVRRIPIVGDDELADLAVRINSLAQTVEEGIRVSEQMKQERLEGVASLSHDIRTPLTPLISYLQLIREEQYSDKEQLKAYAEKAYERAYRIKEMTDGLFEDCVKGIEYVKPLEKVDGNCFLRQLLFDTQGFLEDSGFVVQIDTVMDCPTFYLMLHREKMARVFDNLISNIEKYADCNQPIKIQSKIEDENLILQQENVVIDQHRRSDVESHLLGLKGVERMINEMGGKVLIEEKSNIFRIQISLPIV